MPLDTPLLQRLRDLIAAEVRRQVAQVSPTLGNARVRALAVECDDINTKLTLAIDTDVLAERFGPPRDGRGYETGAWEFEGEAWYPIQWPLYGQFELAPELSDLLDSLRDEPYPPRDTDEEELEDEDVDEDSEPDDDENQVWGLPSDEFAEACVEGLEAARDALAQLPRTPDFAAFVQMHEAPREENLELFRRTVPDDLFETLFPREVAEEDWLVEASEWPMERRARAVVDLVVGKELPQRAVDLGFPPSYTLADRLMGYVGWNVLPAMTAEVRRLLEPRVRRGEPLPAGVLPPACQAATSLMSLPCDCTPTSLAKVPGLPELAAWLRSAGEKGILDQRVLRALERLVECAAQEPEA